MTDLPEPGSKSKGRRKTSLTLDAVALDDAKALGVNVSDVCNHALRQATKSAARAQWIDENREAFAKQAEWRERNPLPFAGSRVGFTR